MDITRTGFCPDCERVRRPKAGDRFALLGGSGNTHIRRARIYQGCKAGYTPHLFRLIKADIKGVTYESTCLMDGCGIKIKTDVTIDIQLGKEVKTITPVTVKTETLVCSIKDWNALVSRWIDTDYYI